MQIEEIKDQICDVCHKMWQLGWVAANDGNVSVRLEDGTFLATPTGMSKSFITPDKLLRIDAKGNVLEGAEGLRPSSEIKMHLRCYEKRADVNAVVHRTNRHSCYLLEYHLVVVTKYRHPVLKGAIKVYLLDQTKTIFDSWHCTIKAVNTDLDHIHILFEAPPQVQLSKLANNYKTVTSRLIRKNFSEQLKQYYWKPYFWSDSYFVCSVSDRTESAVKSYIDSQ